MSQSDSAGRRDKVPNLWTLFLYSLLFLNQIIHSNDNTNSVQSSDFGIKTHIEEVTLTRIVILPLTCLEVIGCTVSAVILPLSCCLEVTVCKVSA